MVKAYGLGCWLLVLAACDSMWSDDDAGTRVPPAQEARDAGRPVAGSKAPPTKPKDAGVRDAGARDAGQDPDAGRAPAPLCPTGACDLLDPLACSDGQGCALVLADAGPDGGPDAGPPAVPQCSPIGDGLDGDPCESRSDCSAGLDCTAFDGTGTCRRYCCALNRTAGCPAGQFCRVGLRVDMEASGVALCDSCDGCDPRMPDACGDGLACYPLSGSRECGACLPAGSAALGASCTLSTECVGGSACAQVAGAMGGRCVAFCDLEAEEDRCQAPTRCRAVSGAALPAGVGLCL